MRFKTYIEESVSASATRRVAELISSYLSRKAKLSIFAVPGAEQYRNSRDSGFGVRFMIVPGARSIRFNWKSVGLDSVSLQSVDIWTGPGKGLHISFDVNQSLVKVLPYIAEVLVNLSKARPGKFAYIAEDIVDIANRETILYESADADEIFEGVVSIIVSPNFKRARVKQIWKSQGLKILSALIERFPDLIVKSGASYVWEGSVTGDELRAVRSEILDESDVIRGRISAVPKSEKIEVSDVVKNLENNRERLTFEQQLEDLENLVRMTVSGASNALFVAGKGGCLSGDTQLAIV
jgi:hypothetical protein